MGGGGVRETTHNSCVSFILQRPVRALSGHLRAAFLLYYRKDTGPDDGSTELGSFPLALLLFALAVMCAVALYVMVRKSNATVGVALLLVAVCIASTVFSVPMIRRSAILISAGNPFCLAIPALHRSVARNLDMTILYARGNRLTPHMMLWVESASGISPYHWSYNRQQFEEGLPTGTVRNCRPRSEFLETLTPVASGLHVALGDDFYIIPSEYSPRHQEDDYFTMDFSGKEPHSLRSASIQAGLPSIRRWRDNDLRDSSPVTPTPLSSQRSDGAFGYEIRTFDAQGLLVEKFRCIRDSVCRLEWVSGTFLFDLRLELTTSDQARDLKAGFEGLWRSFQKDG
jgi:hypothetical protein